MLTLRRGDRLPTVAVVQSALNQHGRCTEFVKVDGIFGPQTERAIAESRLGKNGTVSGSEWSGIVGSKWQIIDSVDIAAGDSEDEDLKPYGQAVISNYGHCNGTAGVIKRIRSLARMGDVVLLRFHGHGGPGNMTVAGGKHGQIRSSIRVRYAPEFFVTLGNYLRPIFSPFGSVEFHGCRVGAGARGRDLLYKMANSLGVPITAGTRRQFGGGNSTFRFEGRTLTVCPRGASLKEWAQANCEQSLALHN